MTEGDFYFMVYANLGLVHGIRNHNYGWCNKQWDFYGINYKQGVIYILFVSKSKSQEVC